MAIPNLVFNPPHDIHLLRGKSTNLKDILKIGDDSASTYLGAHADVTLEFIPLFKSNPPSGPDNTYEYEAITVHKETGVVEAGASAPADLDNEKYNFIVIAKATKGGADPGTNETYIRLQIHRSINTVWLSPERLTVQQGVGSYRFSIYARFDDDVVAEVANIYRGSYGTAVNYDFMSDYTLNFSCATPGLISNDGLITPTAGHATQDYPVSFDFGITSLGISKSATATIRVENQLSGNNVNVQAELVATGNCPGYEDDDGNVIVDKIPNVLFLPDGFRMTDLYAFHVIVDNFVADLVNGNITAPFNLLKGSINFWKVDLVSDDQGATNRGEVALIDEDGVTKASLLTYPKKPTSNNAAEWKAENLVYYFGLPVKSMGTWNKSKIIAKWKITSSVSSGDIDNITEDAINKWKELSDRRLPEEMNTILGIHVNNYTAASTDKVFNHILFNSKRISRSNLDTFLATLTDTDGNLIGDQFLLNNSGPAPRAKDYDRIAIVSAADNGRALNTDGGFFVEVFERNHGKCEVTSIPANLKCYIHVPEDADTGDMQSEELTLNKKATMVHELGHSFGLEDEYGEPPPSDSFNNEPAEDHDGWENAVYDDPARLMDWSANVQARSDLLTPNSGGTGQIDAQKIKWRYDRIEKCGILREAVVQSGSNYTLRLRQGQGAQFSTGDIIRIRKSSASNPIAIVNRTASPDPANQSDTITRLVSDNMQATVSGDEITVSGVSLDAGFLTLGGKEQIIVYKPVFVDETPTTSSDTKEIISSVILNHIATDPYPFNVKEFSGVFKEIIDSDPQQNSEKLPGSLIHGCKSKKRQIVGLYSGGNAYHGHIYHPTGHCFMRNQTRWEKNIWEKYVLKLDEFCPVCKYALVDQIDASKHKDLDPTISGRKIYPE